MPSVPLPDDPSFEQLRKPAKDLRDLAPAGLPAPSTWSPSTIPKAPTRSHWPAPCWPSYFCVRDAMGQ